MENLVIKNAMRVYNKLYRFLNLRDLIKTFRLVWVWVIVKLAAFYAIFNTHTLHQIVWVLLVFSYICANSILHQTLL